PAGFERGDVLTGLYDVNASWFGARVDDYLMTGPGSFSLRKDWYAYEDEGTTTIPVLRSGGSDGIATVNYGTAGGTAIAGVHYRATAGTLTFGAGELLKLIEIPLIDDTTFGHDTTFTLVLTDPAGATIGSPGMSRIELLEDDEPPTLSLGDDLRVGEGDTGTRQVTIPVTLTGSTRVPIHAEWSLYGEDESFSRGLLVFAPGETRKTIAVTIQGDTLTEPDGHITIYLGPDFDSDVSPPIDRGNANITIVDDDPLPRLTILDASAGEPDGYARLHILVSGRSTRPIRLQYTTVSGTAVAGSDFIAKTKTIDVPPHGGRVDVVLADDGAPEAPEWFSVVLSDVENATLVRTSALVTITDDDIASIPALSITGPSVREGDSGATPATFTVQLSAASPSRVLVNWRTEDGTAGNTDYVASAGTLTFEAGETVKTINVDVLGDTATELDEMFTVRLSSPTNATLRNNIGTATIRNDDVSRHRAAPH
ncbi:MAG TPA: Calx-beta domain-containing protein, partial [Thermoanaerobaculia bacterium]|nr:Calx-beta domain-containing protein [Thermoanaerobaculia bacterium]